MSKFFAIVLALFLSTAAVEAKNLFLVGGNAYEVLRDFVRLAGGPNARIAIITHSADPPASSGDALQNFFDALNAKNTTMLVPADESLPKGTDAVYIVGGEQNRLKRLLHPNLLKQLNEFDGLIGGSSAGAMIMGPKMIAGGMDAGVVKADQLKIVDGVSWLPGIVVDSHVGQRNRDARAGAVLALLPEIPTVIGLDEDTAMHIKDGKCTVYGIGQARVFRRGPGFSSNIRSLDKGKVANVKEILYTLLGEGDEFNIQH